MSDIAVESNPRRSLVGLGMAFALFALAPAAVVIMLVSGVITDPVWANPEAHFYNVTLIAIVAIVMAAFMAVSATSLRDIRVLLLSIAYLSSSVVLLTHAMTTPGVLVGFNPWVGFSGDLGVLLAAAFLALAGWNWTVAFQRKILAKSKVVLSAASMVLLGYFAFAMISAYYGFATSFTFINDDRIIFAITMLTYSLLWFAILRFVQLYRRNPSPVIMAVLASAALFLETVVTMTNTDLWDASWWIHHVMLFFAFVVVVVGIIVQFSRKSTLRGVLEGLLLRDSIVQVEREYTDAIIALVAAVEARDPYTFGHSENVANISEQIGRRLGLAGEALEMLHLSALLHDIGKLGIPDQILLKPGRLTEAEFAIIKEHPVRGAEIAGRIGALHNCIPGIRSHHERLDGSGYPDGLSGDEVHLFARIIAVADSYDAMTSERPYRGPLPTVNALEIIQNDSGHKLDARAVQALMHIIDRTDNTLEPGEKSTLAAA